MNVTVNKTVLVVGVAIVLGAGGLMLRGREVQANQVAVKKAVLSVNATQPQQKTWPLTLTANGSVVAWQEAIISAETGNLRIAVLHADVGQRVKKGQLLVEFSRETVEADLRRYEAALASAKASLTQAKANADRARAVKDSGALSDQQVAEYLATEETAQASVDQAAAQVASQKVTLAQTRVVAVDDGIITSKSALLGQVVSAGTELFRMQRQAKLEWQAEVDAAQLSKVHTGAKAYVTLPSGKELEGSVRLVPPTLSTTTSRGNVLVSLPEGATAGMFASGKIESGERTVLAVPQAAVVLRDSISYVFEIGNDEKVIRHRVETGDRHDGLVEIISGIKAEMAVAASGGAFLADGDFVKVVKGAQ